MPRAGHGAIDGCGHPAAGRPERSAVLLMVGATFLLATMSLAVKFASNHYHAGEIAFYRGLAGMAMVAAIARTTDTSLRTPLPAAQFWRSATGAVSMACFFFALGRLPLGTAVTLNYTSSVWIAVLVLTGLGALPGGGRGRDARLFGAAAIGFLGVVLVLRPTIAQNQLLAGLVGAAGGLLAGLAHLQAGALGRAGEPALRTVFYFSVGNIGAGTVWMAFEGARSAHSPEAIALLLVIALSATAAQMMLTRAYTLGRPLVNAGLQYLAIAWAFGFGLVLLGETAHAGAVLGVGIIVAAGIGASVIQNRPRPA